MSDMARQWASRLSRPPSYTSPLDEAVIAPYESSDQTWARSIINPDLTAAQDTIEHPSGLSTPALSLSDDQSISPRISYPRSRLSSQHASSALPDSGNQTPQFSNQETQMTSNRTMAILPEDPAGASLPTENTVSAPQPLDTGESSPRLPRLPDPQQRLRDQATAARWVVYPANQHSLHSRNQRREQTAVVPTWSQTPPFLRPLQPQGIPKNSVDPKALAYVDSVDHNLICPICYCPFDAPRKLPCDHYFCKKCIVQSLESQPSDAQSCPACRFRVSRSDLTLAPKIIENMLTDLKVKCPLQKEGCEVEMNRGSAQDHLDRYCAFSEVKCPLESCKLFVQRKDAEKQRCLHRVTSCRDCNISLMELDIEAHQNKYCSNRMTFCPDCEKEIKRIDLEAHIETCPEAIFPCPARTYGCEFIGRRAALDVHTPMCTLSKLAPFLKTQGGMLEAHEAALKHLQNKNSVLETSFQTIQETLSPNNTLVDSPSSTTPTSAGGPFDSTAHHLLSLHESLREEVSRVSATVSELDAKASMMVMNESLRIKDELTHMNAAIGGMRHQVHWLVSGRLQNEQRMAMVRTQASNNSAVAASSAGSPSRAATTNSGAGPGQPIRRLSDTTRQETKL